MRGDPIPDSDHVLRYVSPSKVHRLPSGRLIATAEALLGKPNNPRPSINWLERFPEPFENQITEIRCRRRLEYKKSGSLMQFNVGQVCLQVAQKSPFPEWSTLSVVEMPLGPEPPKYPLDDPSHAEFVGLPLIEGLPLSPEAQAVGDLMAECILDAHPAIAA